MGASMEIAESNFGKRKEERQHRNSDQMEEDPPKTGPNEEIVGQYMRVGNDFARVDTNQEVRMMRQARILRCIQEFQSTAEFKDRYVDGAAVLRKEARFKTLSKLRKSTAYPEGLIAVGILRAYQEWGTQSVERGLLEVYNYLKNIAPEKVPHTSKTHADLLQAFREGAEKRARNAACEAYADALLALRDHVIEFNREEAKRK